MRRALVLLLLAACAAPARPEIDEILARAGGTWGVYFRDLWTGRTYEHNAEHVFHAASTMKVLVLMKVMRDVEDAKYSLDDAVNVVDTFPSAVEGEFKTDAGCKAVAQAIGKKMPVRELVHWMITVSDNLATNALIQQAGGPRAVTEHARACGLEKTTVARYIMDIAAFEAGMSSRAQAREFGELLERIWRGDVVSADASREMLAVMSKLGEDWLGRKLPAGTRVAHKTGAIDGIRHDVGILWTGSGRAFVLCVLGADLKDEKAGEQAISDLARFFYDDVAGRE